ncbi:MarR family winged helix-turn-helix transcriptional regulator [Arthrobacter sp. ISL-72]|uniref:MarR family winged helix-turn-helix transcriptional regulator n=1 Tax=Arthrobacter sp. ISL-72 TaxID=2819114 RepID=UPI001BECDEF3|nr:MarR family winged helix-turn-helix transcriptional regulator [Arthrobacter sp. ISL-72]MBT2598089.1 winged helix-turn-helix transcriptional regulator [Arthrobacter sp. ISL-72]
MNNIVNGSKDEERCVAEVRTLGATQEHESLKETMTELTTQQNEKLSGIAFEKLANDSTREMFPEYDAAAMALCFNLIRLANRITTDLEVSVHRPEGLSFSAFRLLFAIRAVGAGYPNELARLSSVSTASMSSLLNTLEKYGLVTREADTSDKRKTLVRLTPLGEARVTELARKNSLRESDWADGLTRTEATILTELLRKLLQHHPPRS